MKFKRHPVRWLTVLGLIALFAISFYQDSLAQSIMVTPLPRLSCEESFHCSREPLREPIFPERPLPPSVRDVSVQIDESGRKRITLFTTTLKPSHVLDFYEEVMEGSGWAGGRVKDAGGEYLDYGYDNTGAAPAFSMTIEIASATSGATKVRIRHVMSGPFGASYWPDY